MLYCGFPYSTSAPQSISNTHSSDHILTPIPTTYNSISPSIPFSSFTATSQHYSLQELNSTPAGSVNPHLIYPPHSSVLLPTYNSDSSWTTAQQPPQPSPKLDLKQGDVGNTQKIILDSCLIREDENYVESPDEESVVGQLNFSSLEQEKRYRERRQRNNQAAKHSR
uniref:BZIP domain-containing protein n=1 Tax=Ditylenchus dipsaci TaxID=166011 RepID=A0A915EGY2_9BILA